MKCVYSVLKEGVVVSSISINKDSVTISEHVQDQLFKVSLNEGVNALVSLFSLKSEWIFKECENPLYQIRFDDGENISIYNFDNDTIPDNWSLFTAYVNKLISNVL